MLKYNKSFANLQNDIDGWTPLEDAALKGNIQITKLLLSYGADPNLKDYSGNNAIDLATNYGKGAIVKLLRDNVKKIKNKVYGGICNDEINWNRCIRRYCYWESIYF